MQMWNIEWAALQYLPLVLLLIGLVSGVLLYRLRRIAQARAVLGALVSGQQFLYHASSYRFIAKAVLWLIAFSSIAIVLLRPQWDKKEEVVAQEGRDLFIALDISRSMLAQDVLPSRLEFAKKKIKALVSALSCERVGLILFSGSSFMSCPLTDDHRAFEMFLNQVDVETISSGSTALDVAVGQALQVFKTMPDRKHKLLILVTDGEDFSPSLQSVKAEAKKQGLIIGALGIGTHEGAPIPLYDAFGRPQGHQKDTDGSVVISRLNDALLRELTKDLGGSYVHATTDSKDIEQIVSFVQSFEKEKWDDKKISRFQEQYTWFLMLGFSALVCEWLL